MIGAFAVCIGGEWYVRITASGHDVEDAGPFDDKQDAEMAAERALKLGDQ